jgi:hypothetical protein
MGRLVSGYSAAIRVGTVIVACVAGAFSIHGVVMAGANEAPVPHLFVEGRPTLPFPLDAVTNSSAESSIMAHHGVYASLQVEPMKAAHLLPLLG